MSENKQETIRHKLSAARQELRALTTDLSDEQWERPVYTEGTTWRASDLLRHLMDAERGMTALGEIIRAGGEGARPDFDLARWNARAVEKAKEKTPAELTGEMEMNRATLLRFVDSLNDEDWAKKGRHSSLRMMSIEEILNLIADHERQHAQDIRRAVA